MRNEVNHVGDTMRIVAENLGGARAGRTVFSRIAFEAAEGESVVVTGPNGAGKSTLLRILADLLKPETGSLRLDGANETWPDISAASHFLSAGNAMKAVLTVGENLAFWRRFLGATYMEVDDALATVGLSSARDLPFSYLSTGQQRRVALARLLVSWRPVWLLDEPTAGLDKASEKRFGVMMQEHLGNGGIIVAATHLPLGLSGAHEIVMGQAD